MSSGTWEDRMRPRPPQKIRLDLVERAWRAQTQSGRVLTCGIFRDDHGLEVRSGCEPHEFLSSERAADIGHAREVAAAIRRAMVAEFGELEALPCEVPAP